MAGTMVLNAELEQHSHIGVLILQVGENSVQGEGNSIVCGTVAAICKL